MRLNWSLQQYFHSVILSFCTWRKGKLGVMSMHSGQFCCIKREGRTSICSVLFIKTVVSQWYFEIFESMVISYQFKSYFRTHRNTHTGQTDYSAWTIKMVGNCSFPRFMAITVWRPGVVDWSGGVFASCITRVQLYVNACNWMAAVCAAAPFALANQLPLPRL